MNGQPQLELRVRLGSFLVFKSQKAAGLLVSYRTLADYMLSKAHELWLSNA